MREQNTPGTYSEVCIRSRIHPWTNSPRCSASEYKVEQESQRNQILFGMGLMDQRRKILSDYELTLARNQALVSYASVVVDHSDLFVQTKLRRKVLQRSRAILKYWDMHGMLPKRIVEEYFHLTGLVQDRSRLN